MSLICGKILDFWYKELEFLVQLIKDRLGLI